MAPGTRGSSRGVPKGSALSRALPGLQKELKKSTLPQEEPAWRSTSLLPRPWELSSRHKSGRKILQNLSSEQRGAEAPGSPQLGKTIRAPPRSSQSCFEKKHPQN